jgi:hypothetical protein
LKAGKFRVSHLGFCTGLAPSNGPVRWNLECSSNDVFDGGFSFHITPESKWIRRRHEGRGYGRLRILFGTGHAYPGQLRRKVSDTCLFTVYWPPIFLNIRLQTVLLRLIAWLSVGSWSKLGSKRIGSLWNLPTRRAGRVRQAEVMGLPIVLTDTGSGSFYVKGL